MNGVRPLLHELVTRDENDAVRRLAVMSLRNGSAQRDTIGILAALADDDEAGRELREAAGEGRPGAAPQGRARRSSRSVSCFRRACGCAAK